jgi:hypothetical protein
MAADGLGQGVMGAMRKGIAIDDEERTAHLPYRFRNQRITLKTILTMSEVAMGM